MSTLRGTTGAWGGFLTLKFKGGKVALNAGRNAPVWSGVWGPGSMVRGGGSAVEEITCKNLETPLKSSGRSEVKVGEKRMF